MPGYAVVVVRSAITLPHDRYWGVCCLQQHAPSYSSLLHCLSFASAAPHISNGTHAALVRIMRKVFPLPGQHRRQSVHERTWSRTGPMLFWSLRITPVRTVLNGVLCMWIYAPRAHTPRQTVHREYSTLLRQALQANNLHLMNAKQLLSINTYVSTNGSKRSEPSTVCVCFCVFSYMCKSPARVRVQLSSYSAPFAVTCVLGAQNVSYVSEEVNVDQKITCAPCFGLFVTLLNITITKKNKIK